MTERLYFHDSYLREFQATIIDTADEGRRVYLDRTAFYPTSGGQPHDGGSIFGVKVRDVVDEGHAIAHVLSEGVITGPTECQVDWDRRYDHMQQHTGQHLLSAVFAHLLEAPTVSFHMGDELSTIELGIAQLSDADVECVERRASEVVREARPVTISFEDSATADGLRKPAKRSGELRLVSIEGLDKSACGGTHVRSTAEVSPILTRRMEKIRGNVRIEFVCGDRALRWARRDFRAITALSRLLATAPEALTEHVQVLLARSAQNERDRVRVTGALAQLEGTELHRMTQPDDDGIRRVEWNVDAIDDFIRGKLQAFAGRGRAIALAVGREPAGVLVTASEDSRVHAGSILKTVWASAGARGGGSASLAQGNLPDIALLEPLRKNLGFG